MPAACRSIVTTLEQRGTRGNAVDDAMAAVREAGVDGMNMDKDLREAYWKFATAIRRDLGQKTKHHPHLRLVRSDGQDESAASAA